MTVTKLYKDPKGSPRFELNVSMETLVTIKSSLEAALHIAENGPAFLDRKDLLNNIKESLVEIDHTKLAKMN